MSSATPLWRVLPWDRRAEPGARFSAGFVPDSTGRGRFDLPAGLSKVLYLAESPAHALAEWIHPWRGGSLEDRHLIRAGRRLALVEVTGAPTGPALADFCDPSTLVHFGVGPDRLSSPLRNATRPIALRVWDSGAAGLRVWSRFRGDWRTTVVFVDRAEDAGRHLAFRKPRVLDLDHPVVAEAAEALGIDAPPHRGRRDPTLVAGVRRRPRSA